MAGVGEPWRAKAWCITCLARGDRVEGDLDDFANRCPKHLPKDAPHTLYVDPLVLQAYLKFVPRKSVILINLAEGS